MRNWKRAARESWRKFTAEQSIADIIGILIGAGSIILAITALVQSSTIEGMGDLINKQDTSIRKQDSSINSLNKIIANLDSANEVSLKILHGQDSTIGTLVEISKDNKEIISELRNSQKLVQSQIDEVRNQNENYMFTSKPVMRMVGGIEYVVSEKDSAQLQFTFANSGERAAFNFAVYALSVVSYQNKLIVYKKWAFNSENPIVASETSTWNLGFVFKRNERNYFENSYLILKGVYYDERRNKRDSFETYSRLFKDVNILNGNYLKGDTAKMLKTIFYQTEF
jgi:hypothetical protein